MSKQGILIRTDANPQIGTGHVMRCFALAQEWQRRGGKTTFVFAHSSLALDERLHSYGFEILHTEVEPGSLEDADNVTQLAKQVGASIVVLDGYHFNTEYQRAIKAEGLNLLFVDDYGHADFYVADYILNQNMYAYEDMYSHRSIMTRLLLGSSYVLLQDHFLEWQEWHRQIPEIAQKVLVTLGGSDPNNTTSIVLEALGKASLNNLEIIVVAGQSNMHYMALIEQAQSIDAKVEIRHNVTNMPELMAWADIAISSAGTTAWELAFMGLPCLLISIAKNQHPIAAGLAEIGFAVNLGFYSEVSPVTLCKQFIELASDPVRRNLINSIGRKIVDGKGAERVASHLRNIQLNLRKVEKDDCRRVWEWSNDLSVRAVSLSTEPISWENHIQWFETQLQASNCIFFIAVDKENNPVGQIRYQVVENSAVVSVSLDVHFRGQGYGTTIIWIGSWKLFQLTLIDKINAYVKPDNLASIHAFLRAGYSEAGIRIAHEQEVRLFTLHRDEFVG